MRLDKYIANSTDYSRKQVKQAIKQKQVEVNHVIANDPGQHIESDARVVINGTQVAAPAARYFMLYKPQGYVCATKDMNQPTVIDLLLDEANTSKLHIAGRLDIDTTGLVLITDDGVWTHNVISPNKRCPKRYHVHTTQAICEQTVKLFERGIMLPDETKRCKPAAIELLASNECILTIYEGRFHQVKRMFLAMNNEVSQLHRLSIGHIHLGDDLHEGEYRPLSQAEVNSIYGP